jgi:hypothetical protein
MGLENAILSQETSQNEGLYVHLLTTSKQTCETYMFPECNSPMGANQTL